MCLTPYIKWQFLPSWKGKYVRKSRKRKHKKNGGGRSRVKLEFNKYLFNYYKKAKVDKKSLKFIKNVSIKYKIKFILCKMWAIH